MAYSPITFLEKKWANNSGNNSLVKTATQTTERQQVSGLDYDTHRTISQYGHSVLRMIGRHLYWNCDPIRAAVDEIARLATSTFLPQFYGSDKAWGRDAEAFLRESDNFIDIRAHLVSQYQRGNEQDQEDFRNDLVPSSLRSDAIHLKDEGCHVVAARIKEFIAAKGW